MFERHLVSGPVSVEILYQNSNSVSSVPWVSSELSSWFEEDFLATFLMDFLEVRLSLDLHISVCLSVCG